MEEAKKGGHNPIWHLLISPSDRLGKLPETHQYRRLSHEEFKSLAKNLALYQKEGVIRVNDGLCSQVLRRITGLQVDQTSIDQPTIYEHREMPKLTEDDFALVFCPMVGGMYVAISYHQADNAKFESMVETGIIEPIKDSDEMRRVKVESIARRTSALKKRIDHIKSMLLESASESDERKRLNELMAEYTERKKNILLDHDTAFLNQALVKSYIEKYSLLSKSLLKKGHKN